MKYKVYYSGFYYIEADNEEEAMETDHDDGETVYDEHGNDSVEEVEDFKVEL